MLDEKLQQAELAPVLVSEPRARPLVELLGSRAGIDVVEDLPCRWAGTMSDLGTGIDRLVDVSPGQRDLVAHGLQFFAARRWRELGRPVPIELVAAELQHAFVQQASASVLARVREACDGPLLLAKGPAAAQLYDDPILRLYQDLDLVVAEPHRWQRALIARGFREVGETPRGGQHLLPLLAPGVPLVIEVHGHVKWIRGLAPPPFERLVRDALPFDGADGVLLLPPAEHAALLAVHVWAHDPLTRLLRLIDVAVATSASDTDVVARLVREWGLEKLWRRTTRLIDAVIYDSARLPAPERFWEAQSRPRARDGRVGGVSRSPARPARRASAGARSPRCARGDRLAHPLGARGDRADEGEAERSSSAGFRQPAHRRARARRRRVFDLERNASHSLATPR